MRQDRRALDHDLLAKRRVRQHYIEGSVPDLLAHGRWPIVRSRQRIGAEHAAPAIANQGHVGFADFGEKGIFVHAAEELHRHAHPFCHSFLRFPAVSFRFGIDGAPDVL